MTFRCIRRVGLLAVCGIVTLGNAAFGASILDSNLFSGLADNIGGAHVVSSTTLGGKYSLDNATDGTGGHGGEDHDFVFAQGDQDQLLAVTGFTGNLGTVRLWTTSDLAPNSITLYTSTSSTTSLTVSDYGSPFATITSPSYTQGDVGTYNEGIEYIDIPLIPAGTHSILLDFGNSVGISNGPGFRRVVELQGIAGVPEPSSLVLLGAGSLGLLWAARRRRSA